MNRHLVILVTGMLCASVAWGQGEPVQVTVSLSERLGPMKMDQFALGQGGLSEDPMWDSRRAGSSPRMP